jgi:hypothetical protein
MAEGRAPTYRWRKHIFVLFVSMAIQLQQVLFTLVVLLFGRGVLQGILGIPVTLAGLFAVTAAVNSLWTALHLFRELAAPPTPPEKASLAERQALLTRIRSPFYRTAAVIAAVMTLALSVAIAVTAIIGSGLVVGLIIFYYVLLLLWIGIEIIDWYNDVYILTEDRILDIMRLPIVYAQRTEAPLSMVQNATASQQGIGVILNFGNVQIETAGYSRPVLFENVWQPRLIQDIIFNRIDARVVKARAREQEQRSAENQHWFEAYHTLTGGLREISYERTVEAGRPIHVRWVVAGPPGRHYRTWLAWDIVSRASGGAYTEVTRSYDQPRYTSPQESDGIGGGLHRVRGVRAPAQQPAIYFRVAVWFENEQIVYSSPEREVSIIEPF